MQYYNNILCVEGGWLYQDAQVMTFDSYKNLSNRGRFQVLRRGCRNNPALIAFDSIPQPYRQQIISKYGDPYETTKHNQFKDKIKSDPKALEYYSAYRLPDGRKLPTENIVEYCTNAEILNAIHIIVNDRIAMRKALGGSSVKIWEKMAECVNSLDTELYKHTLPVNHRRLYEKYKIYKADGYYALIHKGFCNDNSRKVSASIEQLILSLYAMPNKPYTSSVHDLYMQFLGGAIEVVDVKTGEMFNRNDFYDPKTNLPVNISESTIWNYINDPKNRVIVDKVRTGGLEFTTTHRPHHHRTSPNYAFSKVSMDDRDLPRKLHDGNRVKAYYAYDVASGCVIGASYSKLKDKSLFIDCMRDMFRFINKMGFGVPMEVEVEHHLVNKFKDDLMKAGVVFPFVRWCNPGNSQEKRAEHFNKVKKYGYEKKYQEGIGRFYAKLEANRPIYEKVSDENNDNWKEKTYSFDQLVADDKSIIDLYNNDLHRDQKRYPGMTRLEVLKRNQNPDLAKVDEVMITRYLGEMIKTTIVRSQYVKALSTKYMLPSPMVLERLEPNNYNVEVYFIPGENGIVDEVYMFQNNEYICTCKRLVGYNEATAEQTEKDNNSYMEQSSYVSQFDKMVKDGKESLSKLMILKPNTQYDELEPETVPVPITAETEKEIITEFDPDYYAKRALNNL